MRIPLPFWLAALLLAALPHKSALAAPQILAVLSSDAGIPLTCDGRVCEADLSTFCLQRERPAPDVGTAYAPAAPGAFTLVVRDAKGGARRLPAAEHVRFSQQRGYTAVSARLPQHALAGLGAVSAAIEVGADASLVPVPRGGDPDPLTADEIAHAAGPLRAVGTRVVDSSPEAESARLVASMANALPREGYLSPEHLGTLWNDMAGDARFQALQRPGLAGAKSAYDSCVGAVTEHATFSMRGCLERRHDQLMRELNDGYWDAFAGS